jgi:hypothetical protein
MMFRRNASAFFLKAVVHFLDAPITQMNKRTTACIMTRLGWGAFFLVLLFLAIQVTPAVGSTLSGTLGTAPLPDGNTGNLATRINRPGANTPTATCAGVTWPGNIGGGTYIYNVHPFINNTGSPICTRITFTMLTEGTSVGNMQLSAFKWPFVAGDITNAARYLGDAGASSNLPGLPRTFELSVPANTTTALVVFNTELAPAGSGGTYRIDLSENPCGGAPATDFNHNDRPDYVLYNRGTRQTAVWYMNNSIFAGGAFGPTLPVGWNVIDVADFDGDFKPDYALFNPSTRQTAIWYFSGVTLVGGAFGPTLPGGWALVATGDFDGDCNPDYVLYNASTRQTAVWFMDNNVLTSGAFGPTLPGVWRVVGVADFNGNGELDYLLFNPSTRQTAIWYLSGTTLLSGAFGPTLPSAWTLVGVGDFNGDGSPDYVLYNASTRQTAIWYMNNSDLAGCAFGPTLPASWSLVAP